MKPSYRLFALAALFAVGVAGSSLAFSAAQEKGKQEKDKKGTDLPKWEYKVTALAADDQTAEKELNKLGDEGWELVGTPSDVTGRTVGGAASTSTKVRLIFKRPKK